MRNNRLYSIVSLIFCAFLLVSCSPAKTDADIFDLYIDQADEMLNDYHLDGVSEIVYNKQDEKYQYYNLAIDSSNFSDLDDSEQMEFLNTLYALHGSNKKGLEISIKVTSNGTVYSCENDGSLYKNGQDWHHENSASEVASDGDTQTQNTPASASVSQWKVATSTDEMTGKQSAYAISPFVLSTQQMDFPYQDVEAWIGIGCDEEKEWTYVGFSKAPNLTNDETKDGYNRISTRIKWDDTIESAVFLQTWGEKFLTPMDDIIFIQKLQTYDSLLVELDWYGQGSVYFEFPLEGASEGIESMRSKCAD